MLQHNSLIFLLTVNLKIESGKLPDREQTWQKYLQLMEQA